MNAEFEEWCFEVVDMGNCTHVCSVCEACWEVAQAAQRKKDAEIARKEKCVANEHDSPAKRWHDRACEAIAKTIEEQEDV